LADNGNIDNIRQLARTPIHLFILLWIIKSVTIQLLPNNDANRA
jgi:hypothetical protein